MNNDYFPSNFAIEIAKEHKLYTNKEIPPPRYPEEVSVWHCGKRAGRQHERLQMFQTVSLTSSFDECLNIYAGIDLTIWQLHALREIHTASPIWMKGKFISDIIGRNENGYVPTQQIIIAAQMLGLRK